MVKRKKGKSEVEKVVELMKLYNAVEITEEDIKNDPILRKRIESDRARAREYLKSSRAFKQKKTLI